MGEFNPCDGCAYETVSEHRVCRECTKGDKFQIRTCDMCMHFNVCESIDPDADLGSIDCVKGSKFELHKILSCEGCIHLPPHALNGGYNCKVHLGCRDRSEYKTRGNDPVNHPSHYTSGRFETIDIIEDTLTHEEFKGFLVGNAIKYLSRARFKGGQTDIEKCIWYLRKWIEVVKGEGKI